MQGPLIPAGKHRTVTHAHTVTPVQARALSEAGTHGRPPAHVGLLALPRTWAYLQVRSHAHAQQAAGSRQQTAGRLQVQCWSARGTPDTTSNQTRN